MEYEKLKSVLERELTKLGYPDDAEDAVQEFYLKRLEGSARKYPYLFAIDYIRLRYGDTRAKKHQGVTVTCEPESVTDCKSFNQEDHYNFKNLISRCLDDLPKARHRDVFYLRFVSELTLNEIAQALKLSENRIAQIEKEIRTILCMSLANDYQLKALNKILLH